MDYRLAGAYCALLLFMLAAVDAPARGEQTLPDVIDDRPGHRAAHRSGRLPLPGTPELARLPERLTARGLAMGAAVLIRVFKAESELELWLQKGARFERFATYPICTWDGDLGPKLTEGDRQSPEGFYSIDERRLRWTGRWHRGLDLGFPNAYDEAQGRTGSALLIHGGCSSVGCYAMTDRVMDEVFDLVVHALDNGQRRVPVQVFPFRMTQARLAANRESPWQGFWQNLKAGHDLFEATGVPPRVRVCDGRYVLEPGAAGYDGGMPVVEQCRPWLVGGVGPEAAAPVAVHVTPGRLAKLLAEIKRNPSRAAALGLNRSAGSGPRIRCKLSLPSCRRWVALNRRGARKPRTAAR